MIYIDLHIPLILSHYHCTFSFFLVNILSICYILANVITLLHKNFCILFLSFLVSWTKIIPHRSLKSYVVTYMWRYELWRFLRYGKSELPVSISSFLTRTGTYFVTLIEAIFLFILFISKTEYHSSSYYYGWDVITLLIYLAPPNYSSNNRKFFGKLTFIGSQECGDLRLICGN